MINRDSWGHSYFIVRGEILGFMKDELLRKHLPRMFSLIKNESWRLEDDQIPSLVPTINDAVCGSEVAHVRLLRHAMRNQRLRVPGGVCSQE